MDSAEMDKYVAITVNAALAIGIGVMVWMLFNDSREDKKNG